MPHAIAFQLMFYVETILFSDEKAQLRGMFSSKLNKTVGFKVRIACVSALTLRV